jgi:hypothetical protein
MAKICEAHERILAQAQSIFLRIHKIVDRQNKVLESEGVSNHFLRHDKELELLMGEKERTVGALREHDKEHGCQDGPNHWNPDQQSSN